MGLATYLEKWTAFYYSTFNRIWVDHALENWIVERELFLTDLALKYPALAHVDGVGAEISDILETDTTIEACFYYRLARSVFLRDPKHPSLRYFAHLMKVKTGMEVYYSTEIGPRFRIEHGVGLVIGPRNRIGSDFTIHQGVTLGQRRMFSPNESMTIGNHCVIFAGAKVLGSVHIADYSVVAANAVLLTDTEPHGIYAGIPAVKVKGGQPA
jgi:serine O-acetyltransferase